jgi:UDP-glucose 4-epimerase
VSAKEKSPQNLLPVVMEVAGGIRRNMEVFGDDYDTPDGTGVRDYIHVNDLASAHVSALNYLVKKNEDLIVNLATGVGYSVLDVINMAEKVTKKKISYEIVGRRDGDPAELTAISMRAKKLLNWEAKHSDIETLLSTMWEIYK